MGVISNVVGKIFGTDTALKSVRDGVDKKIILYNYNEIKFKDIEKQINA